MLIGVGIGQCGLMNEHLYVLLFVRLIFIVMSETNHMYRAVLCSLVAAQAAITNESERYRSRHEPDSESNVARLISNSSIARISL